MPREFHDLAESLLNHESGGTTAWGNLGDWGEATTYPRACVALADQLGQRMALGPDTRLIDVGFGCGDQLLHWIHRYGVRDIAGLNLSHSQTALAQQRLTEQGQAATASKLSSGNVSDLLPWARRMALPRPNALIALDCAYHFDTRQQFLTDAATLLPTGGLLGMTDLLLARNRYALHERAALAAMSRLSHLPRANLVTAETYREQWQRAGFVIESFVDLTDRVLLPFGQWLRRYKATTPATGRARWLKYDGTAAFLRWAAQRDMLRYVLCIGRRVPSEH